MSVAAVSNALDTAAIWDRSTVDSVAVDATPLSSHFARYASQIVWPKPATLPVGLLNHAAHSFHAQPHAGSTSSEATM